jgi:hypothetical protein
MAGAMKVSKYRYRGESRHIAGITNSIILVSDIVRPPEVRCQCFTDTVCIKVSRATSLYSLNLFIFPSDALGDWWYPA